MCPSESYRASLRIIRSSYACGLGHVPPALTDLSLEQILEGRAGKFLYWIWPRAAIPQWARRIEIILSEA